MHHNPELTVPLFLIFILVPVIELAVLIKVGSHIGVLWTLALIFLTAVIGVAILRAQGLATLMRANRKLEEGAIPAKELAEGFLLALAGAMLLTPGFVTDGFGFILLIPAVRSALVGSVLNVLKVRTVGGMSRTVYREREVYEQPPEERIHHSNQRPETIDGDYRRED